MPHVYQDRDGASSTAAPKAAAFKLCMLFSGTPGAANALAGQNEAACWRSRALRARSARVLTLERHGSSRTAALSPVGAPRSLTALGGANASAVVLTHNCLLCRCPTRGESRALPSLQRCRGKA